MKNRFIIFGIVMVSTFTLSAAVVQAQASRTGTNLNSKAIPSDVLALHKPDEVERIRQLLLDGRKNAALEAAEEYLEEVDNTSLRHETLPRYYAWNAYCTVLTSLKQVEEAIAACSTAIAFEPGMWSAVNNRGTAKFVGGRWQEALLDYQAALLLVNEKNSPVVATIEHNISLVLSRL